MSPQMFSDDNDALEDNELADSSGCSSSLAFTTGCLVFLVATIILVAVIVQIAVTSQPGQAQPAHLFRLAAGGMALIVAITVVTVRVVIAASERFRK